MVMPLHDDAPLKYLHWPIANWMLIGINVVVFIAVHGEFFGDPLTVTRGFALIPAVLFGEAKLADWIVSPPAPLTLITSLFFHSSFLHLAGNMLFLYVFGDNVEDAMGSIFYLLFYLCCGVMGGYFFALAAPHTVTPLVGASAAISGVCAAFLLLYPRSTIFGLVAEIILHSCAGLFVRRDMDRAAILQRLHQRSWTCGLVGACRRHSGGPRHHANVQTPQGEAVWTQARKRSVGGLERRREKAGDRSPAFNRLEQGSFETRLTLGRRQGSTHRSLRPDPGSNSKRRAEYRCPWSPRASLWRRRRRRP